MTLTDGSNVTIGHLGIAAGVFDTLEIGHYIDEVIPKPFITTSPTGSE
jgi:hypothetical protein